MRILSFNHHESYLCSLARTGHDFDIVVKKGALELPWKPSHRPPPQNFRFITWDEARSGLRAKDYDLVIAHTVLNLFWILPLVLRQSTPIIFVAHIPLFWHSPLLVVKSTLKKAILEVLRVFLPLQFLAVSKFKQEAWGIEGFVVDLCPEAISPAPSEEKLSIITVGNQLSGRAKEMGFRLIESLTRNYPITVIGQNPELRPECTRKPKSYAEFSQEFQKGQIYLYTIKRPFGDGYNTAMLEAMSLGMPVVTLANPSSPIMHGENGLIAHSEDECKAHLDYLLAHPSERERMGQKARETVDRVFSRDLFKEKWSEAIASATQGVRGSGIFLALLFGAVFGVAIQNLVFSSVLGVLLWKERSQLSKIWAQPGILSGLGFLGVGSISTLLNPTSSWSSAFAEPMGYLFWLLLPALISLHPPELRGLRFWGAGVGLLMALLAFSQWKWNWKMEPGFGFDPSDFRARGFFSHPLSLAYAALLAWPMSVQMVLRRPFELSSIFIFLGSGSAILFSQSRMVQAIGGLYFCYAIMMWLKPRFRALALGGILLLGSGTWISDNMISRKFKDTIGDRGLDRHTTLYADDRFAFWHAHARMFLDAPFLGHGWQTDKAYRVPYYEGLGLRDFEKPYPAHNMFLQILVNAGILGFLFFFTWIRALWRRFRGNIALRDTILVFSLASLTQNSFQDFAVRTFMTLLLCLTFSRKSVACQEMR